MPQADQLDGNKVAHNPAEHRFEINTNGQLSVLEYVFKKHRIFFKHTEVKRMVARDEPSALKGKKPVALKLPQAENGDFF
jgi:hypothetical protein